MPEIPEIETIKRLLEKKVRNKTIKQVVIHREKALNVTARELADTVTNQTITEIRRRAKQIIVGLSNKQSLVVHFMLEGYVRLFYPHEEVTGRKSVVFELETGEQLVFFKLNLGYLHLVNTVDFAAMPQLTNLGPEPLDDGFTPEVFLARLAERRGMIKPLLMDQEFIAGLGNVYSNETLFCSKIMPTRKVTQLDASRRLSLYHCIRDILTRATVLGGVYEEKFTSDDTLTGSFEPHLKVAYRTGQPCYVCGHQIETKRVGGRNAFFCPNCQQ